MRMYDEYHRNKAGAIIAARSLSPRLADRLAPPALAGDDLRRLERADRTLIVGEDNPYGAAPEHALYPAPERSAGARLGVILGLERGEQVATWRANLCQGRWRQRRASARAAELLQGPWRTFLLLGAQVRLSFERAVVEPRITFAGDDHVQVSSIGGRRFILIPHPSGRCRLWNIPGMEERARRAFQEHA